MAHLSATKLTFTPAWGEMDEAQRQAEQVAAYELIAKHGGTVEAQWILWSDQVLLTITSYPDETSSLKAQMAITARGAFLLQSQTALALDDFVAMQAEAVAGG